MELLDGIDVACFDLFDTLIRVDVERLPSVPFDGRPIRSTLPIVHQQIFAPRGIALGHLAEAVRRMWMTVREELNREDGSDDERWAEMAATDKYRRVVTDLGVEDPEECEQLAREMAEAHHAALVSASLPMEGADEVLGRIRARGIRTALVSNWDHSAAGSAMLEHTALADLLDHVVISEAVGVRKPHRRIFDHALEPFDGTPERALHVGDLAKPDAWGAGRLGFRTVWINKNDEPYPEAEHPPTLEISRLADLLEHL
jgi:HAD superfamily hydrolase (TIGR01509 family)